MPFHSQPPRSCFRRAVVVALITAGCGGGADAPAGPPAPPVPVVTTVEVTAAGRSLLIGDTIRLQATARDQNGAVMSGVSVTWSSAAPSVVSVDAAGLVTAVAPGTGGIQAASAGRSGSTPVTVLPPVASLVLSPDSATIPVAGTLALQVALRDAGGAALGQRAVSWTSLDPVVASVTSAGVATALQLGTARIVASAEGKADTARIRVPALPLSLTLEPATARSAAIGPGGGTLVATSAAGLTYTLTVPAGALPTSVSITMTPIGTVASLPLSGGFVAGVDFAPAGLTFARSATLDIQTGRRPAVGQVAVGITYAAAGSSPALTRTTLTPTGLQLRVAHFSGVVTGFGTSQDLFALAAAAPVSTTRDFYMNAFVAALTPLAPPADTSFLRQVLEDWFDDAVAPPLAQASTDAQLLGALGLWDEWQAIALAFGFSGSSMTSRQQQWRTAFVPKVRAAIDGNKQVCHSTSTITSGRLAALDAAIFWMLQAGKEGLHSAANGLSATDFRLGLCASVVVSQTTLTNPLTEGVGESLDIRFALRLTGSAADAPANFEVQASAAGAAVDRPGGLTALTPPGLYSTVVTPASGTSAAAITLDACYSNPVMAGQEFSFALLCRTEVVTRAVVPGFLTWNFDQDLEGWSAVGNAIQRSNVNGRTVARLDLGGGIVKSITLPPRATIFEFDISAHDRPLSTTSYIVELTGPQGSATLMNASKTGPVGGGYAWSTETASVALFAGQTVTIRITQFDQAHGQLYIDRIRIR